MPTSTPPPWPRGFRLTTPTITRNANPQRQPASRVCSKGRTFWSTGRCHCAGATGGDQPSFGRSATGHGAQPMRSPSPSPSKKARRTQRVMPWYQPVTAGSTKCARAIVMTGIPGVVRLVATCWGISDSLPNLRSRSRCCQVRAACPHRTRGRQRRDSEADFSACHGSRAPRTCPVFRGGARAFL